MKISGQQAWANVLSNPGSRWGRTPGAFDEIIYPVRHTPKFALEDSARFFCIGSCFARNIEEHLIYRGATVLSRRLRNPRVEWHGRPNGIINKFTAQSMLNEVRWLETPLAADQGAYVEDRGGWMDLQLAPQGKPVTLERAIERRRYLTDDYFSRLRACDVVIITLGLNEAWLDQRSGLYLNAAPSAYVVKANPDRYVLDVLPHDANLAALEELRARLLRLNPTVRMIVTVSPVPLGLSFTGQDPTVANTRSKSILRAVADAFSSAHQDVDYFPSYEMITLAPRARAFAPDCTHVTDAAVSRVIERFFQSYGFTGEAVEFNELAYLQANLDVFKAVREGTFESGFQHWMAHGRAENRPMKPETPNESFTFTGAV